MEKRGTPGRYPPKARAGRADGAGACGRVRIAIGGDRRAPLSQISRTTGETSSTPLASAGQSPVTRLRYDRTATGVRAETALHTSPFTRTDTMSGAAPLDPNRTTSGTKS